MRVELTGPAGDGRSMEDVIKRTQQCLGVLYAGASSIHKDGVGPETCQWSLLADGSASRVQEACGFVAQEMARVGRGSWGAAWAKARVEESEYRHGHEVSVSEVNLVMRDGMVTGNALASHPVRLAMEAVPIPAIRGVAQAVELPRDVRVTCMVEVGDDLENAFVTPENFGMCLDDALALLVSEDPERLARLPYGPGVTGDMLAQDPYAGSELGRLLQDLETALDVTGQLADVGHADAEARITDIDDEQWNSWVVAARCANDMHVDWGRLEETPDLYLTPEREPGGEAEVPDALGEDGEGR